MLSVFATTAQIGFASVANPFSSFQFASAGTSTGRTLPDRLAERINVKDFGATGDGSTDDWNAVMSSLTWNSVYVTAAQTSYSGAVRYSPTILTVSNPSWVSSGGGTVTAITPIAHGLTTGDIIFSQNTFSSGAGTGNNEDGSYNGVYTVTVVNSTKFTYSGTGTTDPGPASSDPGYFTAAVTSVSWASNTVTVNFGTPHRLVSGLTCVVSGLSSGSGSRVITVTSARQLTFPLTGSGAITATTYALVQPAAILVVNSTPSVLTIGNYYMQEYFPTCYAASYETQLSNIAGTTLTFGNGTEPFWADITAGDIIRLTPINIGEVWFPPGTYHISQQLQLSTPNGASGSVKGSGATIRGNFADFLLSLAQKSAGGGPLVFEGLSFINDHANGSCLRMDGTKVLARNCSMTFGANGLWTSSVGDYRNSVSFNAEADGCIFKANASAVTSVGINAAANALTVRGCYFVGLSEGIRTEDFFFAITGNQFVNCGKGVRLGLDPFGTGGNAFGQFQSIRGNAFNNCGYGIAVYNASATDIRGNYIVGGASATYGFDPGIALGSVQIRGMEITGLFSAYAIVPAITDAFTTQWAAVSHRAIRAANSGGSGAWLLPSSQSKLGELMECNKAWVTTYATLPGRYASSFSYNSGTGVITLTTDSANYFNHSQIAVSGATSGGGATSANGVFAPISQGGGGTTVTYTVGSNPGTIDAGTGIITSTDVFAYWPDAAQGRTRANISDGAKKGGGTAAIGDLVVGGGSQHIRVAWTQLGWQRIG